MKKSQIKKEEFPANSLVLLRLAMYRHELAPFLYKKGGHNFVDAWLTLGKVYLQFLARVDYIFNFIKKIKQDNV